LVNEVGGAVIKVAQKKKLVKTIDLQKSILGRLNKKAKSVASAWKRAEKKKKK